MRVGSLCTGAGMLDHGAMVFLDGAALAWVAEMDPAAAGVLAKRVPAPNLGDISEVDWGRVEPVDVLVAGYPCQDLSNAGKRAGIEGAKSGVWRHVADAVRVLRPRLVFLENVRGHLARGFGRVLGDLAELGYDTSWTCLRASDVGACHQRDRVFVLAAPSHPDGERVRIEPEPVGARIAAAEPGGDRKDAGLSLLPTPGAADAVGGRRVNPTVVDHRGRIIRPSGESYGIPLASLVQMPGRWGMYGPAIRRQELVFGRPAPEPTVTGKRGGQRLSGRFVEWMMGWPEGWATDLVDNKAALRIGGNGVVPQQAAAAYRSLLGSYGGEE